MAVKWHVVPQLSPIYCLQMIVISSLKLHQIRTSSTVIYEMTFGHKGIP